MDIIVCDDGEDWGLVLMYEYEVNKHYQGSEH